MCCNPRAARRARRGRGLVRRRALATDTRYELAAEAITRVLNFVEPQHADATTLRIGAGSDAHFARTAADASQRGASFTARAGAAVRSIRDRDVAIVA